MRRKLNLIIIITSIYIIVRRELLSLGKDTDDERAQEDLIAVLSTFSFTDSFGWDQSLETRHG
jgi:hypothetical protein